jgi:hypothetical protein
MSIKSLLFSVPLLTACVTDPEVDVTTENIAGPGAGVASQFQRDRAATLFSCTATRISARWLLTAAHCMAEVEDDVGFYSTGPGDDPNETAEVDAVVLRPGVNAGACFADTDACWDTTGTFADIALLRLKNHDDGFDENDLDGHQAMLAHQYPGDGEPGVKIGSGNHGGLPNEFETLMQIADTTSSMNDNNGMFFTWQAQSDQGDSGGPFYYGNSVLGVHRGSSQGEDYYTSVPEHLKWILTTIDYQWRGQPEQASTKYTGTLIESFFGNEDECQYVCEKMASCEAYSFDLFPDVADPNCFLYDAVTGVSTDSTWKGALKHGTLMGQANSVVGYVRSDGLDAVVHVNIAGEIRELVRVNGQWQVGDPQPSTAPAVHIGRKVAAYRRHDGTNAIVYRSTTNRIIELALDGTWDWSDLTSAANAELSAGQPAAYVKADGVSAVVYRGATTGHIIELRLGSRGWVKRDLMAAAGSSATAESDPTAFVRSDGFSSVVFQASDAVYELRQSVGGSWVIGAPSVLAGGAPAVGRPFGFTHSSGTNAIVYRTAAGQIIRLTLAGTQWSAAQLATGATGDPSAYTRTDMVESVVFRNSANKIIEAAGGATFDLNEFAGAPAAYTNPSTFHRVDGFNAVLFETSAGHVRELTLKRGQGWGTADLTAVANETP